MSWAYKNFTIHEFDKLESTNSHAFELATLHKIYDNEIILAKSQTSGRGRQNRNWSSPTGNLYFSLVLMPKTSVEKISQISFIAASALCLAMQSLTKNSIKNKWPNDILVNNKKIAGILLESKISQTNCEFIVLGIGVNISSYPNSTIFPATSLADLSIEISPQDLLKKILDTFEEIYQNWLSFGFAGIRRLWLQNAYRLNEEIIINNNKGVFSDIDLEGNLLLKIDNEKLVKFYTHDVFNIKEKA